MTDFKPGDVVVHPKHGRGIVQEGMWVEFAGPRNADLRDVAADLRRLVVIDPEDREQVERLAKTHLFIASVIGWDKLHPNLRRDLADAMKTALHEFAEADLLRAHSRAAEHTYHSCSRCEQALREAKEAAWWEGLHEGVTRVAWPRWPKKPNPYREQKGREE